MSSIVQHQQPISVISNCEQHWNRWHINDINWNLLLLPQVSNPVCLYSGFKLNYIVQTVRQKMKEDVNVVITLTSSFILCVMLCNICSMIASECHSELHYE